MVGMGFSYIKVALPSVHLEDNVIFEGEGNDMGPTQEETTSPKYIEEEELGLGKMQSKKSKWLENFVCT